jgi:hypothetical protein
MPMHLKLLWRQAFLIRKRQQDSEKYPRKGGTKDPMEMYIDFRGREPEIGPLLRQRGLQ